MPSGGLAGRTVRFTLVRSFGVRLGLLVVTIATVLAGGGPSFGATVATKTVRYLGYTFQVPASWPVIYNSNAGSGCVRFDQHAVYLGKVGANQFCPSWLLGTTESLVIEPGPGGVRRSATENPVARQISVQAPGIAITATFAADPGAIYQILASAGLPSPVPVAPRPAGLVSGAGQAGQASQAGQAGQAGGFTPTAPGAGRLSAGRLSAGPAAGSPGIRRLPVTTPKLPLAVTNYRGLGFDACAAPSAAYLKSWLRSSPYRAIGIYIGGADRACAQANLTPAWVRQEAQNGWHFLPLYAGPQAAFGEIRTPAAQGASAAADAVAQAQRLGFGPATPIYYDMEAYPPKVRVAALKFLSAWTAGLHQLGYSSGVYSSSDSGIADLASQYSGKTYAMPDVIYDALWNGSANTADRHLGAGQWANHRRVHQFSGNLTKSYGGASINIDEDFLDVQLAQSGGTAQASPAISLPGGSVYVFYRSGQSQLYLERYQPNSGWARPVLTGSTAASVPSAIWTGSEIDVFYTDANGYLWQDQYQADGSLIKRAELPMMGQLGWGPVAVSQPGGAIDVFWRGSADQHLWHGQYLPGSGWTGPQNLGGDLSSAPAPVNSAPGLTAVFFEGTDTHLWQVSRSLSGGWSAPVSLGMGKLGGAPQATAQASGAIEVFWPGSADSHMWEAYYQPGQGWHGPSGLGGTLASGPWPVTAGGTVRVLWRGPGGQLYALRHRSGATWRVTGWDGPQAVKAAALGSRHPFAAAGPVGGTVWAFWWDASSRLWSSSLAAAGNWTVPSPMARPA